MAFAQLAWRVRLSGVTSPTVSRLQLGRELKSLREGAGHAREEVARGLDWHVSKLSKIETGGATLSSLEVKALLALYGVTEVADVERMIELARQARRRTKARVPEWARAAYGLEAEAVEIRDFQEVLVPGLLQTEAYTRALTRAIAPTGLLADEDRIVESRGERQARLSGKTPPQLWVVLHEAAIRAVVGGPEVMQDQLGRLVELAALPTVSLQVIPFRVGAHAAMGTSFTILRLPDPPGGDVVYLEDLWSADYLNRAGQVGNYTMVFDRLSASALSREDSATMIREVAGELT